MMPTAMSRTPLPSRTSGNVASAMTVSARTLPSSGSVRWPAPRRSAKTSRAAKTVTTATPAARTMPPTARTTRSTGTRMAALIARWRTPARLASEPTLASGELEECRVERGGPEIGPQVVAEVELSVGRLPDQEIGEALFATGPDHEVGIGQACGVQDAGHGRFVDRLR